VYKHHGKIAAENRGCPLETGYGEVGVDHLIYNEIENSVEEFTRTIP
jgi:hypothetical protein